jgi:hypothetical protein
MQGHILSDNGNVLKKSNHKQCKLILLRSLHVLRIPYVYDHTNTHDSSNIIKYNVKKFQKHPRARM